MNNMEIRVGLCCGEIADIVFPHNMDRNRRNELALALVELTRLLRDSDADAQQDKSP